MMEEHGSTELVNFPNLMERRLILLIQFLFLYSKLGRPANLLLKLFKNAFIFYHLLCTRHFDRAFSNQVRLVDQFEMKIKSCITYIVFFSIIYYNKSARQQIDVRRERMAAEGVTADVAGMNICSLSFPTGSPRFLSLLSFSLG